MDLLIRNGTIVDGTGAPARPADIRIQGGRIAEIGQGLAATSEQIIDAAGAYVTPGFIDTHTHFDASLYWDPLCDPMLQHGVTTVLIGNCGLGLAPLRAGDRPLLIDLFAYVEDMPPEVLADEVPWTWEDFGTYAQDLNGRAFGPNVCVLTSHSLLRQWIMGAEAWSRAATPDEIAAIARLLDDALRHGARGLSTSFFDRTADGRLVPSAFAADEEFEALFEVLGGRSGICQIIPRLWSTDLTIDDLTRLGIMAGRHGVRLISNGIFQRPDEPDAHLRLQECSRELETRGCRVQHLASPRPIELPVRPSGCFALGIVAAWAELVNAATERKFEMLRDPAWRASASSDWEASNFRNWAARMRITRVGRPELEPWIGRYLPELAAERGGCVSDVIADWFLENDLDAEFVVPITNLDTPTVGEMLADPVNLISGSDAGAHYQMFSGAGDSTLVLTRHVRDRADLPIELAIRKMTADQAELLGLDDRGTLAEGQVADITVFDLAELDWAPEHIIADVPGGRPRFTRSAGGYRCTIINGMLVYSAGQVTSALAGRVL